MVVSRAVRGSKVPRMGLVEVREVIVGWDLLQDNAKYKHAMFAIYILRALLNRACPGFGHFYAGSC